MIFLVLPAIVFASVVGIVMYVYYEAEVTYRRKEIMQRLGDSTVNAEDRFKTPLQRALLALGTVIAPKKQAEIDRISMMLNYAGYRSSGAFRLYHGLRLGLAILAGGGSFVVLAVAGGISLRTVVVVYIMLTAGYFAPLLVLKWRVIARRRSIFRELPDTLDVLLICINAGLSFDRALFRVSRELRSIAPVLSREFEQYFYEVESGFPKHQALSNLSNRNGSESLTSTVNVLIQSSRFGTNISHALSVRADSMRTERRQIAEEKGAKISAKLVFPTVLLIMPAFLLIVLGPAAIRLFDSFDWSLF